MIVTGLLALVLATLQHRVEVRRMRTAGARIPPSLAAAVALAVTILGIGALGIVVLHQ